MTTRTLTEITDIDDDEITTITVGPDGSYCVEVTVGQWSVGERDPSRDIRVRLETADAIALRDALTMCIDEALRGDEEAEHVNEALADGVRVPRSVQRMVER